MSGRNGVTIKVQITVSVGWYAISEPKYMSWHWRLGVFVQCYERRWRLNSYVRRPDVQPRRRASLRGCRWAVSFQVLCSEGLQEKGQTVHHGREVTPAAGRCSNIEDFWLSWHRTSAYERLCRIMWHEIRKPMNVSQSLSEKWRRQDTHWKVYMLKIRRVGKVVIW